MKKVLGLIVVVIFCFLAYAYFQPSEMYISREILIQAKPELIFPHINNSKRANDWMPWAESDPKLQMTYSGPEEGVGSTSSWSSEGSMGTGKAVIVESIPSQKVKTELIYTNPMSMTQMAEISLSPSTEGTLVKWSVSSKNSFVSRLFGMFINVEKMVGEEFEKGLKKLKAVLETK